MMKVWHKLFVVAVIFIFSILQLSVFPFIHLIAITPNLLMGFTASEAIMRGQRAGMFTGVLCGLVMDMSGGYVFGAFTLIYAFFGFVAGYANKLFLPDDIKWPLFVFVVTDFVYGIVVYVLFFLFFGDFSFAFYLLRVIIPETVYTVVVMLLLYPLILRLDNKFLESEKRNAKKFI